MGVPVSFQGVSTYPDGDPVCGLFDRPGSISLGSGGSAGIAGTDTELRIPCNAFAIMPTEGDIVTLTDEGVSTNYQVNAPEPEDDGAFLVYKLYSPEDGAEDGDES